MQLPSYSCRLMHGDQARFFEDEIREHLKHKVKGTVAMASASRSTCTPHACVCMLCCLLGVVLADAVANVSILVLTSCSRGKIGAMHYLDSFRVACVMHVMHQDPWQPSASCPLLRMLLKTW